MTLKQARTRGKKACRREGNFYIILHPTRGYEFTLCPCTWEFEPTVEEWTLTKKRWKRIA